MAIAYRSARAGTCATPRSPYRCDGGRSFALDTLISADGWQLEGCPDQGSALTWNPDGRRPLCLVHRQAASRASTSCRGKRVTERPESSERSRTSLVDARHPRLAALGSAALLAVEARAPEDSSRGVIAVRALEADGTLTPWSFLGADAEAGWVAALDRRTALASWVERTR